MLTRFLKWFIFTLLFAPLPLVAVAGAVRSKGVNPSLEMILGTGELLAICCALSAAAIGDVIAAKTHPVTRMTCAAVCGFVVLASIIWYAVVGAQVHTNGAYDKDLVVFGSMALYGFSALASAFCVGVAEKK